MKVRYGKMYTFQWHITHKCNLRCRHCYLDEYAKEHSEIDLITVLGRIIQFLNEQDAMAEIDITGGEPFTYPGFYKILDWLENEPRIVLVAILSNGTLIDDSTISKLKKYKKLKAIQISIDGVCSTHDSIRGIGNYDKAINALKILHNNGFRTSLSFTANRDNYKEFSEIAKIASEIGVDVIWTDRVIPLGDKDKKKDLISNLVLNSEEFKEYIDIIKDAKEKYDGVRASRTLQYLDIESQYNHICFAGVKAFTITADCELMPCRRLEENYGSVLEKPISQILEEHKEDILKIHTIPDGCKNCEKVEICKGGAKCLTCAIFGDYNHPDPNCKYSK